MRFLLLLVVVVLGGFLVLQMTGLGTDGELDDGTCGTVTAIQEQLAQGQLAQDEARARLEGLSSEGDTSTGRTSVLGDVELDDGEPVGDDLDRLATACGE